MLPLLAVLMTACNKYDIQPEQAEGFIKFFSSTLTEVAYDVKETADGGYVAIGTTSDEEGIRDLYLVKTDKYGNEESWSPVTIQGDYDDVGTSIQVVDDGFVILGHSKASDTSNYDMYLLKTDLQGNVLWEKRTSDANDEIGTSLIVTSSGDYLAAGISYNSASGNYRYKIALFKENDNNVQESVYNVAPESSATHAEIIEAQNDIFICGTEVLNGKSEISMIQVDKSGLGGVNQDYLRSSGDLNGSSLQELSDGNILVCGTVSNPQTGITDIYLNKLSSTLGTVTGWENPKRFSVTDDQVSLSGEAVRIVNDNSYAIVGTRTETGNDDIILLHSDGTGNEVIRSIFGDEGFQQGLSLEVTADGGLILVGNNGSEDNSMMALVRTDATGKL